MSAFHFPHPGERTNAAAIPIPTHTLLALLAAALAWEIYTNAAYPDVVPPQIGDATSETIAQISEEDAHAAIQIAERLMRDRMEAERGA